MKRAVFAVPIIALFFPFFIYASIETETEVLFQLETPAAEDTEVQILIEENRKNSYPALTIEVPETALVQKYRDQYTSSGGIQYLSSVMQRSGLYRDFILSEIERLEAPEFLLYLPVIESGFSPKAVSRSGATGVWQFMRNSIGGYGMRINEWMDERRDPWLSSTAAVRKLMDNYRDLGDWYLALAAYNCGLGAVRTAIKKAGKADYWYLCEKGFLKQETVHYVPKFLAVSEILSKSDDYGISWGETGEHPELTTITVKRPVDIQLIAAECGIDTELVLAANPSLFYNITPPDVSYALRIPCSHEESVKSLLDDTSRILLKYYMYTVKSGDTLYALSNHYGVSVDMILQHNPGLKPSALQIGKNIVIPAFREVTAYKGKKDSDTLDFSGTYLVKKGDTLWSIALAYNIQVETLAEKNNLDVNAVLKLGKQLHVPIL
ncbi:LysM peptidoglycan-binding domain-containing protein [Brucepastera parasyntrophica]|uniref:lytic transglycosylase domain-containing protein n=1 Tax=Brucepastera parasyntrophica TaxID=2880008 RepID=UPI00210DACCE|nr:lytic transglycosylase domain-containing protein [Brucepastera parasyntrophica]ULQ60375.1 LysM peptidoglycan-binding domain-containing protein [Brucepastera parasyntrophica]